MGWISDAYSSITTIWRSYWEYKPTIEFDYKIAKRILSFCPNQVTDDAYKAADFQYYEKLCGMNLWRLRKWVKDSHDCDNYAFEFFVTAKSIAPFLPLGVVFVSTPSGNHALNFFITYTGMTYTFWYLEPQTNEIFSYDIGMIKEYEPYFMVV